MDHEDTCMHACRFNMERTNELNNPPRTDFMFLKTVKMFRKDINFWKQMFCTSSMQFKDDYSEKMTNFNIHC